jgi:hypothetical protein
VAGTASSVQRRAVASMEAVGHPSRTDDDTQDMVVRLLQHQMHNPTRSRNLPPAHVHI